MKGTLLLGMLFVVLWSFFSHYQLRCLSNYIDSQKNIDEKETVMTDELPRTQWRTSARVCDRKLEGQWFKSQDKEDKKLLEWFGNLCNGTYAEMGGLDGVLYSNSYVFNRGLDWKGVLVELGPRNFAALQRNRPNELATVHAAVCEKQRTLHYLESAAVGGIWELMAPSFREKWHPGVTLNQTISVECKPLKDIFDDTVGEYFYFDFFTLDVEGAEYEAIASLDFTKVGFGVIVVEADEHNQRKNMVLLTLLESKGYTFLAERRRSYWFVNKEFGAIYKDLVH